MIQKNIGRLNVAMDHTLAVHVAQRVSQQPHGRQYFLQWQPGYRPEIRAIDELLAIKSDFAFMMKFEYAHDMCVHEANTGLPFVPQTFIIAADLENDGRRCQAVFCEPQVRLTTAAQPAVQCVPVD